MRGFVVNGKSYSEYSTLYMDTERIAAFHNSDPLTLIAPLPRTPYFAHLKVPSHCLEVTMPSWLLLNFLSTEKFRCMSIFYGTLDNLVLPSPVVLQLLLKMFSFILITFHIFF